MASNELLWGGCPKVESVRWVGLGSSSVNTRKPGRKEGEGEKKFNYGVGISWVGTRAGG